MIPQTLFINILTVLVIAILTAILVIVIIEAYLHYNSWRRKPVSASEILYANTINISEKKFRNLRDKGLI